MALHFIGHASAADEANNSSPVVVVDVWTAPQYDWDQKTGEADGPNIALFATLKEMVLGFGSAIQFTPNMYINDGDSTCSVDHDGNPLTPTAKQEVCDANCANGHRYCEVPPVDAIHSEVTGIMLLAESLRRMCIWDLYGQDQDGNWNSETNYFEYLQSFYESQCDVSNFSKDCVAQAMGDNKMSGAKVQNCYVDSGAISADANNVMYQAQVDAQKVDGIDSFDELPAVLINGEVQKDLTAESLFAAICKAAPKDQMCVGDVAETLGDDEDKAEEKPAEEALEKEIAEDLGEDESAESPTDPAGEITEDVEESPKDPAEEEKAEESPEGPAEEEKTETVDGEAEEKTEEDVPQNEEALEQEEAKLEGLEAAHAGMDNPIDHHNEGSVIVEVWTTTDMDWDPETGKGDGPNIALFDHLREVVVGFSEQIEFRPQYYISTPEEVCGSEATDEAKGQCEDANCSNGHKYCAIAPDDWLLTGKSMVEESLRRICLWEVYGRNDDGEDDVLYFDYLAKFHELKCDNEDVNYECIYTVFKDVKIEAATMDACIKNSGGLEDSADNDILKEVTRFQKATFEYQKLNADQVPLLLINGKVVEDATEKSLDYVFKAICDQFPADKTPDVCNGDLEENLGEDEDKEEEKPAEEALEKEIAEEEGSKAPETGVATESPVTTESVAPTTTASESETTSETPAHKDVDSAGDEKAGIPSPNAPDTDAPAKLDTMPTPSTPPAADGNDDGTLYTLDLKIVDEAIGHLAALENCEVDTASLIANILALGGTDGHYKDAVETIESDIPLLMTQNCPHEQGVEILSRMEEFHKCALFDLQELIETFPSTAVGVMMRCADAYSGITKEEEEKGFIPEECIRTLEADSMLGRGIFGLYLYPDIACPCFEHLANDIPECTADVWPIPINGALVKVQSCLVGQYCQTIDSLCDANLKTFSDCLPPVGTKPSDMVCSDIFDKCSDVYDNVPPMLSAAPLPDACKRVSEGSNFYAQHVVERYDAFRHQCGENIELWEGHTPVAEFKAFVKDGILGVDYRSMPFVSGALGGFFAGIIFTIVVIILRKFCLCVQACFRSCCERCCGRKKKKNARPTSKEYATVETDGESEEVSEYRD